LEEDEPVGRGGRKKMVFGQISGALSETKVFFSYLFFSV
jgi:hypothetical protein